MTVLPILFEFRQAIPANGFVVGVEILGACLVEDEGENGWWAHSVYPAGLSADGDSMRHAVAELEKAIGLVLEDYAHMYPSYGAIEAQIRRFYAQNSPTILREFEAARAAVRSGELGLDHLKQVSNPEFRCEVALLSTGPVGTESDGAQPKLPKPVRTDTNLDVAA